MASLTLPSARQTEFAVIASVVGFVALAAVAAVAAGGAEIWAQLSRISLGLLASLLALSLLNYGLRILRWHLYARHLGLEPTLKQSAMTYVAGFAMTTTPGRVGEAFRLWLMERVEGHRYERTLPLLVADRISDMGAVGLLLLVGLSASTAQPWLLAVAAAATSVMVVLALWPRSAASAVYHGYRLFGRWPRLFGRARKAARDTAALFTPKLAISTLVLAVIGWAAECFALYLTLHALGAQVGLFFCVLVFTAGMLVGALTLVPGGLGGTEGTMLALLAIAGVPMSIAIPATVVSRVTTLWFAVGLGFAVMPAALRQARAAAR